MCDRIGAPLQLSYDSYLKKQHDFVMVSSGTKPITLLHRFVLYVFNVFIWGQPSMIPQRVYGILFRSSTSYKQVTMEP